MAFVSRDISTKIIDEIIRYGAFGALITAAFVAPNILQVLGKPFGKLVDMLDQRDYERQVKREAQRVIRYMKQRGYLAGDYEHGLQLTEKARQRLAKIAFRDMHVTPTQVWDRRWRIILYDVPEDQKSARDALGSTLRRFGCFQLQKSVWITPFSCREEITQIAAHHHVDTYVTYFEAINLDNEKVLLKRFRKRYPGTQF